MLDWVKKLHQEGKLKQLIDKDLNIKFDRVELEEIVQVALLCNQFNPSHRPKMSEVMKMLEGDGLAERWEASQNSAADSQPHLEEIQPELAFGNNVLIAAHGNSLRSIIMYLDKLTSQEVQRENYTIAEGT